MTRIHTLRQAILTLSGLFLLFGANVVSAANSGIPAFEHACILTSDAPLSVDDVIVRGDEFACDVGPADVRAPYVWLRLDGDRITLPEDPWRLESDFAPVERIRIAIRHTDGSMITRQFGAREIADSWTAGARFSLPLTDGGQAVDAVYIGIDRSWSAAVSTVMEVMTESAAEEQRYGRTILFAIYCGLTLVPILYSLAFYTFLRYRFMLLHALMATGIVLYTFASSNLMMHFFPTTTLWARLLTSYSALAMAIGMAGFFSVAFIEPGKTKRHEQIFAWIAASLLIANALFMMMFAREMPHLARTIYNLLYIPALFAYALLIVQALRRGSRAARFLLAGWLVTGVVAVDRIMRGLDIYVLPAEVDFSLYFGLTIEAIVTAFGVADRFVVLRREHDQGVAKQLEEQRLAQIDTLTGLPNRRAFDASLGSLKDGAIALIDLDQFKRINDTHGKQISDDMLRTIGNLFRDLKAKGQCRAAYRLDGDRFAVISEVEDEQAAQLRGEALRQMFIVRLSQAFPSIDELITASVGLAMVTRNGAAKSVRDAEEALRRAKDQGRNCVIFADQPPESPDPFADLASMNA